MGLQTDPAIASNGQGQLFAAWVDTRHGDFEIMGARIEANTWKLKDESPIRVSDVSGAFHVHVIFDGTDYVVLWSTGFDLFATIVTTSGDVKAKHTLKTADVGRQIVGLPAAVNPNGGYMALYMVPPKDSDGLVGTIYALPVDKNHSPSEPKPVVSSSPMPPSYLPGIADIAFVGGSFVVVYSIYGLKMRRIKTNGDPLDPNVSDEYLSSFSANAITMAFASPSNGLLVWETGSKSSRKLYALAWKQGGPFGPFNKESLIVGVQQQAQYAPKLVTNGTKFFLAWIDDRKDGVDGEVFGGEVDLPSLKVAQQIAVANVSSAARLDATYVAGAFVTAWAHGAPNALDVYAARYMSGSFDTMLLLSQQANRQRGVAVASNGSKQLAVWSDRRKLNDDVYGVWLGIEGGKPKPLGSPFDVSVDGVTPKGDVAVTSDGVDFLVAYRNGTDAPGATPPIVTRIVSGTGPQAELFLTTGSVLQPLQRKPAVAFDGTEYVVLRETGGYKCEGSNCQYSSGPLLLSRVDKKGQRVDADMEVAGSGFDPLVAALPSGGMLAVWEQQGNIQGARILKGKGVATVEVSAFTGRQSQPAIAFSKKKNRALAVWRDERNGGQQLYGRILDATLAPLGKDFPIATTIASSHPRVVDADDDYNFLVVWEGSAANGPSEVYGSWVKSDGTVATAPQPISPEATKPLIGASHAPSLAPVTEGELLVAFDRLDTKGLVVTRAMAGLSNSGKADGTGCTSDVDCRSRFCQDAVCCSTRCNLPCSKCASKGDCEPVTNDFDPDSCDGPNKCDLDAKCKLANGQSCKDAGDCASGVCVSGVCCDRACDMSCESCLQNNGGICIEKSCGLYRCAPGAVDKTCLERCTSSLDCVAGAQCVDGRCASPQPLDPMHVGCGCRLAEIPRQRGAAVAVLVALALVGVARRKGRAARREPDHRRLTRSYAAFGSRPSFVAFCAAALGLAFQTSVASPKPIMATGIIASGHARQLATILAASLAGRTAA
jgi:hypothetical protein